MLAIMSKPLAVHLTQHQRQELNQLVRGGTARAREITRARILLLADKNQTAQKRTQQQIAEALLVSPVTVCRICRQFTLQGMAAALSEKPRPGKTPKITGEVEAQLVTLACSEPPQGQARWTLQLLADKLVELNLLDSISDVAVYKRLKKTRSSPGASSPGA